jgi:hypothetical protein
MIDLVSICPGGRENNAMPMRAPSTSESDEILLGEEEISDVSLSTFYVFDKENTEAPLRAQQMAARGCGCCCAVSCDFCGRSCTRTPAA